MSHQYVCIVNHADDLPGSPNAYGPFSAYNMGVLWAQSNGIGEDRVEILIVQDPARYSKDEEELPF